MNNDLRRQVGSPRSKGRENRETPCRNILIYGHCRYEDAGCTFSHDQNKNASPQSDFNSKKTFNVESPSFTPSTQPQAMTKKSTFSSQAASAAPFTPRGVNTTTSTQQNSESTIFNPGAVREFTPHPQNYEMGNTNSGDGGTQGNGMYNDPFTMSSMAAALPPTASFHNPYPNDSTSMMGAGGNYYQQPAFPAGPPAPALYHLQTPYGEPSEPQHPWQRGIKDFFIDEKRREEFEKKSQAARQTMPNSGLPSLKDWHSLVPLDMNYSRKNKHTFGYTSWLYKALESKRGRYLVLRRLAGYVLTNENAIPNVMTPWKKIRNANIVTVHGCFTTREFGDSSLLFVYTYWPLSKTLHEFHFPTTNSQGARSRAPAPVAESILWSYICQITNALLAIHSANLAARCLELSKIIVEPRDHMNHIRLSACAILDVVHYDSHSRSVLELQQEDLVKFGKIILSLATGLQSIAAHSIQDALDSMATKYSTRLKEAVTWLISPPAPGQTKTIHDMSAFTWDKTMALMNSAIQAQDELGAEYSKEAENGRVARLCLKLNTILDNKAVVTPPSKYFENSVLILGLFRDYVFHQVEADGRPSLSLGHMMTCMAKLDASIEERVLLTTRDNDRAFLVSYRDLRTVLDRSFNDLQKAPPSGLGGVGGAP